MEDAKIIELFFERVEHAISATAEKYGSQLLHLAQNILRNQEDSEECVNDTYHITWNHIPPTRPEYFFAYLAKIDRHLCFDKLDYKKAKKRNADIVNLSEEMENCIPAPDDFERKMESEAIGNVISDFLRSQPVEMRKVFVRRYWYIDSVKDIASFYQISESKVKSILFRMRNSLREYLEREGIVL